MGRNREPDAPSDLEEDVLGADGVVTVKPRADSRKLFAVGLGDVEHWDELEASDDPVILFVLGVGVLVDHRGENPDGLLSLAVEAIPLPQGVDACDLDCLVALGCDEEHVPEGVAVETALEAEAALPVVGRREVADPLCQLLDEFRVIVLGGHF